MAVDESKALLPTAAVLSRWGGRTLCCVARSREAGVRARVLGWSRESRLLLRKGRPGGDLLTACIKGKQQGLCCVRTRVAGFLFHDTCSSCSCRGLLSMPKLAGLLWDCC